MCQKLPGVLYHPAFFCCARHGCALEAMETAKNRAKNLIKLGISRRYAYKQRIKEMFLEALGILMEVREEIIGDCQADPEAVPQACGLRNGLSGCFFYAWK